jgi:HSP20 family protein
MTQLTAKKKNGSFPRLRNDYFTNRLFFPRLFDLDDDFFGNGMSTPPANVTETEKEYNVELSVPGMNREDLKIDIDDGVLSISSETKEEHKSEEKNYHRREFSYSSFKRTFTLPENASEENIKAKYENGMLKIAIPKAEQSISKPKKQIKIE